MEIQSTIKIRIYPKKNQIELLNKHFGATRFIWNHFLNIRKENYLNNSTISIFEINKDIIPIMKKKEKYSWLKDVDSTCLQNSIKYLDIAYKRFFNKISGFPKFKTKKSSRDSFQISMLSSVYIDWENKTIKLPKFKERIKFRGDLYRKLIKMNSITISRTPTGKYYASIQGIFEHQEKEKKTNMIGVDLGIKDLVIDSGGNKIENPKFLKRKIKKLKYLQKQHSKSKMGSTRREKKRRKLVKVYENVTNSRKDYLHKVSSKLINENQVIIIEDLSVKNMIKNRKLSQAISDVSWGSLISFLKYKSEWNSRQLIKIDRFFPSSKTCSECGWINKELTLNDRSWECNSCYTTHDRDINAAKNILKQGINILSGLEDKSDMGVFDNLVKQKSVEASSLGESMKQEVLFIRHP